MSRSSPPRRTRGLARDEAKRLEASVEVPTRQALRTRGQRSEGVGATFAPTSRGAGPQAPAPRSMGFDPAGPKRTDKTRLARQRVASPPVSAREARVEGQKTHFDISVPSRTSPSQIRRDRAKAERAARYQPVIRSAASIGSASRRSSFEVGHKSLAGPPLPVKSQSPAPRYDPSLPTRAELRAKANTDHLVVTQTGLSPGRKPVQRLAPTGKPGRRPCSARERVRTEARAAYERSAPPMPSAREIGERRRQTTALSFTEGATTWSGQRFPDKPAPAPARRAAVPSVRPARVASNHAAKAMRSSFSLSDM